MKCSGLSSSVRHGADFSISGKTHLLSFPPQVRVWRTRLGSGWSRGPLRARKREVGTHGAVGRHRQGPISGPAPPQAFYLMSLHYWLHIKVTVPPRDGRSREGLMRSRLKCEVGVWIARPPRRPTERGAPPRGDSGVLGRGKRCWGTTGPRVRPALPLLPSTP